MAVREILQRQRGEIISVLLAFTALIVAAPTLIRAGSIGWRNGILFAIASFFNGFLPGNFDVPVVIAAGVIVAWLLLFVLDGTKRIQTLAMIPTGIIVVILLGDLDHVVDAIRRAPVPFALALIGALSLTIFISGRFRAGPSLREHGVTGAQLLQFPLAARGLFVSLSVAIAIVVGQYPFIPQAEGDPRVIFVIASGAIAIFALGTFVQYRARRDVVTLVPDGIDGTIADAYTLIGLYDLAKARFYGTPLDKASEQALERAITNPERAIESGFHEKIRFGYLSRRLRRLIVEINTADHRFSSVVESELGKQSGTRGIGSLRYHLSRIWASLKPNGVLQNSLLKDNVSQSIVLADQVLIAIPYPEGDNSQEIKRAFELFVAINRRTPTEGNLVITHADRADTETDEFNSNKHRRQVLNRIDSQLSLADGYEESIIETTRNNLEYFDNVYLLNWDLPHGQDRKGFERLLTEISG